MSENAGASPEFVQCRCSERGSVRSVNCVHVKKALCESIAIWYGLILYASLFTGANDTLASPLAVGKCTGGEAPKQDPCANISEQNTSAKRA